MDASYYKEKYEPIDGKWYINKEIGKGAFGTVFEIERKDYGEKSALKIITIPSSPYEVESYKQDHYTHDEQSVTSYFYGFVEEFIQEFKLMSKLKGNSNIVSIEDYDIKKHNTGIGWDILIRMELLTPMNVHFSRNALTKQDVIKLGIDICKALEVCKEYNVIHRDLKPSNIFISPRGDFKLGDFGVARTLEKTSSGLSKKGTYTYMAPEIYKGEKYGQSVDIYSLGIVMYKLLNNNNEPFRTAMTHQDEESALNRRMKGEPIPSPANADEKLSRVILKACCYNPQERYSDPTEMRRDLEQIAIDDSIVLENLSQSTNEIVEKTEGIFEEIDREIGELSRKNMAEKTVGIFENRVAHKLMVDESATSKIEDSIEGRLIDGDKNEINDNSVLKDANKEKKKFVFNFSIMSMSFLIGINILYGILIGDIATLQGAIDHLIFVLSWNTFSANPQIPTAVVSVLLFVIVCINLICNIVLKNKKSKEKGLKMFNKILPYVGVGLTTLSFAFCAINLKINSLRNPAWVLFDWRGVFDMTQFIFIYLAVFIIDIVRMNYKRKK